MEAVWALVRCQVQQSEEPKLFLHQTVVRSTGLLLFFSVLRLWFFSICEWADSTIRAGKQTSRPTCLRLTRVSYERT